MKPDDRKTSEDLKPADVFSWPLVLAMLERAHPDAPYALKLGMLSLAKRVMQDMCDREAPFELIGSMYEILDVLAHLPWQQKEEA